MGRGRAWIGFAAVGFLSACADADGDGFAGEADCDDANAEVSPAATEVCNGIDDDCDGLADDPSSADASAWYLDTDGNGLGNPEGLIRACDQPFAAVPNRDGP
ncbi:MAG: hypothetical protein RLZZ383_717 [Pseudomonadota bacterium]|jgi:hypothetical protein